MQSDIEPLYYETALATELAPGIDVNETDDRLAEASRAWDKDMFELHALAKAQ